MGAAVEEGEVKKDSGWRNGGSQGKMDACKVSQR